MTTPIPPSPNILLIENDPALADEIRTALTATGSGSFDVEWVRQLSNGIARLGKKGIAAVLLELSLPDSQGIETFDKLFTASFAQGTPLHRGTRTAYQWQHRYQRVSEKRRGCRNADQECGHGDVGVEALIRWQQPDRGLIAPAQFVPVAEDCGRIVQIGRWVLREACRQARAWQNAGLPPLPIAFNVSAVEFRDKGFVEGVRAILSETGLQARYLELELTERVLMEDAESTASVLQELKMMGVHLAVDDFGTGYSSLSYLRQFPIDVLKIDRSFVDRITANPDDSSIVSAIIHMGKSLKHRVIAEGIETQEQRAYLQTQRCTEGQGYLFSRPLCAAQFAHLLEMSIRDTAVH